jgi:hypothetical protein
MLTRSGSAAAIVLAAAVLVLLPYGLLVHALPIGRDSGVFMYTGMIVEAGGMPYVDSWDHKGPLLYVLNALGMWLFGGPRGVIVLEGLLLFAALGVSMQLWKRLLPTWLVLTVAAAFALTYYATFENGNLTESWLIPFALVSYALALAYVCAPDEPGKARLLPWLCVLLGVSIAIAALTRPNNGLALGLLACCLLAVGTRQRVRALALMVIAFAVVVAPALAWIHRHGAWHDFVEQYLVFNFAYAHGVSAKARIVATFSLAQAIFLSPLALVTAMVCAFAFLSAARPRAKPGSAAACGLLFAVFAVELLSQLVSGRGYLHYASLTSASLAVALVALLYRVTPEGGPALKAGRHRVWALFLVPVLVVSLAQPAFALLASLKQGVRIAGTPAYDLSEYLRSRTSPTDRVLVHGAETWLLAASGRLSPTAVTYYYPVIDGFRDSLAQYQSQTLRERPMYVVETPGSCGLTLAPCAGQPALFAGLKDFLARDYRLEKELHGYRFWRLRASPATGP